MGTVRFPDRVTTAVVNGSGVLRLSTTTGVSLTATGQTSLYTVPTGKALVILHVIVHVTAASGFVTAATARVGKSPNYDEYIAATALAGLNGVGEFTDLSQAALLPIHQTFAAGETVAIDITIGAVATTLTATVDVVGYLV